MDADNQADAPISFEQLEAQVFALENKLWIADRRAEAAHQVLGSLILNLGRCGVLDAPAFLQGQLDAALQLGGPDAATSQYVSGLLQQQLAEPLSDGPSGLH